MDLEFFFLSMSVLVSIVLYTPQSLPRFPMRKASFDNVAPPILLRWLFRADDDAEKSRVKLLHALYGLYSSILAPQTQLHFAQAKAWAKDDWKVACSFCLLRLSLPLYLELIISGLSH